MISEQRIRELCAQLLRAENPAVMEAVTAQLKTAIDQYTSRSRASTVTDDPYLTDTLPS